MRKFISYKWMKKHVLVTSTDEIRQSYENLLYSRGKSTIHVLDIMYWIWYGDFGGYPKLKSITIEKGKKHDNQMPCLRKRNR